MAKMIPNNARMFSIGSLEDIMFKSLQKLPDDYYVFHSFKILTKHANTLNESETDFIIFNRHKGILCLEAKNGSIYYKDGDWFYGSGLKMKNDGPFNQASANKWKLKSYIEDKSTSSNDIISKCKLLHAVWFPAIDKYSFNSINLPSEANKSIILTKEDLDNPTKKIEEIFNIELPNRIKTNLTERDEKWIVDNILCPTFNIVPSITLLYDLKKESFNQLFEEQKNILNYLEDQRSAVINGVAGTGKTMLAVEKARRHGVQGQKVLFLCYNNNLKEYLNSTFKYDNVSYYTIDGFACKICKTIEADYSLLKSKLEELYYENSFEYDHIVIDEGQDFGQEHIEEEQIIDLLEFIVLNKGNDYGTFYLFYDKLQFVQGKTIPKYITEADCKFSLYKNCRNTENIAKTSMIPLKIKPKLFEGCVKGESPHVYICKDNEIVEKLNHIIDNYIIKGLKDIVILTAKSEIQSFLKDEVDVNIYKYKNNNYRFYSCRKFKGLEADVIILIDVDKDTFINERNIFYVGASRARLFLDVITTINENDCVEVLNEIDPEGEYRRTRKGLVNALNSIIY